ncbi:LAETG motif-containing sortase-dependent surface protein [Streptomyces celluloflavus]|uniref:LAETG motif-containing sortase-dependent surface protein n=1 Tax=Streptomyces celluloflavus TaxID=58344 RepID=UPI003796B324
MKLSRISSVVAAAAIAPAVLFASPAVAADTATSPASSAPDTTPDAKPDTQGNAKADENNRFAILKIIDKSKPGSRVYEAAQAAMNGSPEDRVRFLDEGYELAQFADDKLRTAQILSIGGKGVRREAGEALKKGTHEALRQFLEVGQYQARDEDNAVEITSMLVTAKPGSVLYDAIQEALDGSPEDRTRFLEVGQHAARETDDRIRATRIAMTGGPHVKEAAKKALRSGKAEDIRRFLDVGQYEARKLDEAEAAKGKDKNKDNGNAKDSQESKEGQGAKDGKDSKNGKAIDGDEQKQNGAKEPLESHGTTGVQPAVATSSTGSSDVQLASTGAGSATPWVIGGSAVALTAGAGLMLTARRRAASEN